MNDHGLMDALRATRRLSDSEIASGVDRHALSALREGITMTDRHQTSTVDAPRRGRRLGRRGATSGVLALVLVGGGAAYAVSQLANTPTLDGLNCAQSMTVAAGEVQLSGAADGRMTSGDDLADCAQIREDAGLPALVDPYAFLYQGTHFVVARAGVPAVVMGGAQASRPNAEVAATLELESAIEDWVDGPRSRCLGAADAEAYAQDVMRRVRVKGWTVRVVEAESSPDSGPCADVVSLPTFGVIEVRAHARKQHDTTLAGSNSVLYRISDQLRAQVVKACLSLAAAEQVAQGIVDAEGEVVSVPDESASCTRVDMEVGGSVFVTLRGPSIARP